MILRSEGTSLPAAGNLIPAWEAVLHSQQLAAAGCWFIAQPDHAALAGDLAERFARPPYPRVNDDVVRAIRVHDAGWASIDGGADRGTGLPHAVPLREVKHDSSGRPLSFLDVRPEEFLIAWNGSIERATELSGPTGGFLVSSHFCRLGRARLESTRDTDPELAAMQAFLAHEDSRQDNWLAAMRGVHTREQLQVLTDLLQFCDLLSLYLCCGSEEDVIFPQIFEGWQPKLRREVKAFILTPTPFDRPAEFRVTAVNDGSQEQKAFDFLLR